MPNNDSEFSLVVKSQRLDQNGNGQKTWIPVYSDRRFIPRESVCIVCDMWDKHWSRGATERVSQMAPRINDVLKRARDIGVHIIHAPSDTMEFYKDNPARKRIKNIPVVMAPYGSFPLDIPLPIDDSDGGSDTGEECQSKVWTRQHTAIDIDHERDVVSDDGTEIYSFIVFHNITNILLLGVHSNMCILNRPFGIKKLKSWNLQTTLVRDLTDAMYNPERPPYVNHEQGTHLVIEYIEKFWCSTIESTSLPW